MDQKMLIGIVAAAVVVAAAAGIAVFALGGDDNTDDNKILVIKEAGTYNGTYDSVIIDPAVGDGTVTLNGVVINGDLKINGGGSHSIILTNCEINGDTVVAKDGGETPRIYADGTDISNIIANCNVILESTNGASFGQLNAEGKEITIQGDNTSVDKITVIGGKLTIDENSNVDNVEISGNIELNIPAGSVSAVTVTGNTSITGTVDVPLVSDSAEISSIIVNGESKHVHHMVEAEPAVAPTCTSAGHATHYKCSNYDECGFDYPAEILDPIEHVFSNPLGKAATCTEAGIKEHWHCSSCNKDYIKDVDAYVEATDADLIIPAAGHDLEHHEAVAATCTAGGNIEYYVCKTCNEYFSDSEAMVKIYSNDIPTSALGHDWEFTAIPAVGGGCTVKAACNRDHAHDVADVIYAQGYLKEGTGPTCTGPGIATYILYFTFENKNYNEIEVDTEELPATGHNWQVTFQWSADHSTADYTAACLNNHDHDTGGSATVTDANIAATCTEKGVNGKIASATIEGKEYSETYGDTVAALGHAWGDPEYTFEKVDGEYVCKAYATCTRDPSHELTEYGEITTSSKPTCTEGAEVTFTAVFRTFEDYVTKLSLPALGHDLFYREATEATCTEPGHNKYEACSRCEYTTYTAISPLGHDMGEWIVLKEATLTSGGLEKKECSRCDYYETQVINYGDDGKFQVTVFGGYVTVKGTSVDTSQTTVRVPAGTEVIITYLGENLEMWMDSTGGYPAGNEFMLLVDQDCWFTAHEKGIPHVFSSWTNIKDPTCTEPGYRTRTGSVNGEVVITDYWSIAPLGHILDTDSWTVDLEPTCTTEGVGHYTCTRCNGIYSTEIDANGHELGKWTVTDPAEGSHIGTKSAECKHCDYVEEKQYISTVIPTGNIAVIYDWEDTSAGVDSSNMHNEWHISYVGDDGKQTYLFYLYFDKSSKYEMTGHIFFYYVDEGENSPVYIARTNHGPSNPQYGGTYYWAYDGEWGIGTYVDNYQEFLYFIDNNYLGHSNGKYGTTMYDMYHQYEEDFNKYGADYFRYLGSGTIAGISVKTYADIYDWHYYSIDENYCTLGYGNYTYVYLNNERQVILSIEEVDCNGYLYAKSKFSSLPTLPESYADVNQFTINMVNLGSRVWLEDDDFAVPIYGPSNGYFSINRLGNVKLFLNLDENYHLVSWQVKDLDGNWVDIDTVYTEPTSAYPYGYYTVNYGNKTLVEMYDYLSKHSELGHFAAYHTAQFSDVIIRAYVEPNPYNVTVTTVDSYMESAGGVHVTEAGYFNDAYISVYAENRIGYSVSWKVLCDGQPYENWYDNGSSINMWSPETGAHKITVTATYTESQEKKYTINVSATDGGYVVSADGLSFPASLPQYTEIELIAEAEPGYLFYGWYLSWDGMEDEGFEYDSYSYGDDEDPFAKYGRHDGDYESHFIYVCRDYVVTAVFVPVDLEDLVKITVSKDSDGIQTGYASCSGLTLSSMYVQQGSYVSLITNPNADEVTWWSNESSGKHFKVEQGETSVYNDTVIRGIYAKDVKYYTLSYAANNGVGEMDGIIVNEFEAKVSLEANGFTKYGHVFDSWNTKADGTGTSYSVGNSITLTSDLILYAIWAPNVMYINYEVVNEDGMTLSSDVCKRVSGFDRAVYYGSPYNIPEYFKYLYGYTFVEWNTKADGTGTAYHTGDPVAYSENGLKLYSILKPKTYHVSFDLVDENATGGYSAFDYEMPTDVSSNTIGITVDIPGNTPTLKNRVCYYFFTDKDGSGKTIISINNDGSTSIYFNNLAIYCDNAGVDTITVYAKWQGITYDIELYDGDSRLTTTYFRSNETYTTSQWYGVSASLWDGWMFDPDGDAADLGKGVVVSGDILCEHLDGEVVRLYMHRV